MLKSAAILGMLLAVTLPASAAPALRLNPYESHTDGVARTEIDKLVLARLEELKIEPANLCSDGVFVRRAYLDVIGTLPSAQEAKDFILDRSPGKRRALIDKLLERDEFADYWAMKWCDLLRVKAEFPINLWPNAAQAYHRWIRDEHRDQHALRPVRARTAHVQRQQFPRAAGQLSTARCKTRSRRASPKPSR
jgi:hypothetical protein